jgi:hypothetical protein
MQVSKYLLKRQSVLGRLVATKSLLSQNEQAMYIMSRRFLKQQVKAVPTQASHISEDFDTLLKKLSVNATSENVQESTKAPIVIKQKDDVVYISDPKADWRYWGALKVGDKGTPAITISLQKDQAIALLLKKSNAQGTENINAEGSS